MEKLTEIFAQGGYAAYVWPSFIVAGAAMAVMTVISMRSLGRARRALAQLQSGNET